MVMIADFEAISPKATTRELCVDTPSPIDMALAMKTANLTCGWGLPVCESRFHDRINRAALHPLDSLILEFALEEPTLRACVTKQRISASAGSRFPCIPGGGLELSELGMMP